MPIYTVRNTDPNALQDIECDVCIIGSGAGGATVAARLCEAGKNVVLLEAGHYDTQADFNMDEGVAFQRRYQEQGLRSSADLGITVLQGKGVGGSTTINWTSCFRTPERILDIWQDRFGVEALTSDVLEPHFERVEERLNIQQWQESLINPNNQVISNGAKALGWEANTLRRNVKGCMDSGYCGMGCPANAKQGMLLTHIPDALQNGLRLYANTKALRLEEQNGTISAVIAEFGTDKTSTFTIRPKVVVSSCGAINGPALFLRSGINDNGRVGKRTFLHPVVGLASLFDTPIKGWYGAPQSVSSHQFIDRGPDKVGFFFEAAPTHPILAATAASNFGMAQQEFMAQLSHTGFLIALHVDGVLPDDEGGTVSVASNGKIMLDYPIGPHLQESFKESMKRGAELALASGAKRVQSLHFPGVSMESTADIDHLDGVSYGTLHHGIFTAHQMGGLCMGSDPKTSVVNDHLQHHRLNNLFVVDGSVFPTSLGVNPSESIYGIASWASAHIIATL